MRTAASISATIIAVGLYLAVAATIGLSAAWIGLGILAISVTSAVALVATNGSVGRDRPLIRS